MNNTLKPTLSPLQLRDELETIVLKELLGPVRYTTSEAARREVLARLLKLNHERYADEVKRGLHEKKKTSGKGRRKQEAGGLFD